MGNIRATATLLGLLVGASPAIAHHISGNVYCDQDVDGVIDVPGDTPIAGVTVTATSLDFSPGQSFTDVTDGSGGYNIGLPARTDRYRVQLSGLAPGLTVVLPGGGTYTIQIVSGTAQDHADGVNFLVQGCAPTTTTTTSTTTTRPTTTTTSTTTTSTPPTTLPVCVCPALPFLVSREAKINNDASVGASVGANASLGRVRLGKDVIMPDGTSVSGDTVQIGNASSVFNVRANTLLRGEGVTIRGSVAPAVLPLVTPFCSLPPVVCGTNDVLVPVGQIQGPLAPGVYGRLRVLNGGTVTLAAGRFVFCDIKMGRSSTITTFGPVTLDVAGNVVIGTASRLGPATGTDPVLLNVRGSRVRVSQSAVANVAVVAPAARITFGRDARLLGCFCTDRLKSDKHITLECPAP